MGDFIFLVFGIIWAGLCLVGRALIGVVTGIAKAVTWLFGYSSQKRGANLLKNIQTSLLQAQTENQNMKTEAETILRALPNVPERLQVQDLADYCTDVDNTLQQYIDSVNQDLCSGNPASVSSVSAKYGPAQQFVSSIHYALSVQDLQNLTGTLTGSNYFINTLLAYCQVQNLRHQNGDWTYTVHGTHYQMRLNEADNTVEIRAKAQNPIRFTPNRTNAFAAMPNPNQTLYFDENHELVIMLKKDLSAIDHYDVFEFFDHVAHLLGKKQINPSAGKSALTYSDAEEIEDVVSCELDNLPKVAPPPPDLVPDGQKMYGGTMRWANYFDAERCGMLSSRGFILGKMGYGAYLYSGDYKGHILTIASTQTGKGVGVVIPNLLLHKGSAVVLDPKGENFAVTANARLKLGSKVFYYDPWDVVSGLEKKKHGSISVGAVRACINPLDAIEQNSPKMLDDALLIASSMIVRANSNDTFFYSEAETFLARLICYVCTKYPQGHICRNLIEVRRLSFFDLQMLKMELEADKKVLMRTPIYELSKWIDRNLAAKSRSVNNVIDVVQQATNFLSSPTVAESLKKSNIDIMRMKLDPTSLYLILDTNRIVFNEDVYKPLVRLIVTTCFCAGSIREQAANPMLFMMDEIAQLGNLQYLPKLLSISAGSGVVVWSIWQSFSQIQSLYDKDAGTIINNCSIQQYFGVNDTDTAELICKKAGMTTIFEESYTTTSGTSTTSTQTGTWGSSTGTGSSSSVSYQGFNFLSLSTPSTTSGESKSYTDSYSFSRALSKGENHSSSVTLTKKTVDLITPGEVMQAKSIGVQFLFYDKCPYPILCGKIAYYEDKEFYGVFDKNYAR